MKKQILLIITGLPYSGKTTLTKRLVQVFGFETASVDEFIRKGKYGVDKMEQKDWDEVYSKAYKKLENLLKDGKSVIFDGASLLKSERDTLRRIAQKYKVAHRLIYVNTPIEVIEERWARNRKEKERGHLKKKTLEKALSMFEEPGKDEYPILYAQEIDFEVWVDKNFE